MDGSLELTRPETVMAGRVGVPGWGRGRVGKHGGV